LASWAGRNSELWGNETRINGVKSWSTFLALCL
jgi:hypothetical protein